MTQGSLLLVSSSGGVLLDLLALKPWWSRSRAVWAVVEAADTVSILADQRVYWIKDCSLKKPFGILTGFVQALCILRNERPGLLVSAGSGPAIPFFLIARILGIPTFWIFTLNIVKTPGISARICARLSSRVLLQHRSMLHIFSNAVFIGELF